MFQLDLRIAYPKFSIALGQGVETAETPIRVDDKGSLPNRPTVKFPRLNAIDLLDAVLPDICGMQLPLLVPENPIRVSKSVSIDLSRQLFLPEKWIGTRDSVLPISARFSKRIYAPDAAVHAFSTMIGDFWKSVFCRASVPIAHIQEPIIGRNPFFSLRIEGQLLHPVGLRGVVYPQNLTACSLKHTCLRISGLPLGQHPLHKYLQTIRIANICIGSAARLGMGGIEKPIFCKFRVKSKTSQASGPTRFADHLGA